MWIRAAKTIDDVVIGMEVLEQWYCLKVYGISLEWYLRQGNMELFKKEVEFLMEILLKTISRWLMN